MRSKSCKNTTIEAVPARSRGIDQTLAQQYWVFGWHGMVLLGNDPIVTVFDGADRQAQVKTASQWCIAMNVAKCECDGTGGTNLNSMRREGYLFSSRII